MIKNVPKLRFKGFEDEWKEYKLGDFSEKITKKNKGFKVENVISNSAKNGLISQRDFFEKDIANKNNIDGYYIIKNGDFVYNPRKSNEAPYGPINKYKFKDDGVVSPLYFCFRIDNKVNNDYLEEYFKSSKWYKYVYMKSDQGARHDRVSIKDSEVMNMKIKLPSLSEQEKIANFLRNVDKIIEEQEGKVKDLELYKKGMMQKIFKQEIRFKDDNGQDYPKWEEKKLGVLGSTYTGLSRKTKEDFGFGKGKYITYMNVFNNIRTDIGMIDLVDIKENENQNTVLKGDLLFTTSSETPQEVGMVSVCDNDIKGLYLNSFCFGFRFNELSNVNSYFMASYLRSPEIRMKISILAQGSTRYNLSKTELMKIKLLIPCLAEQTKIDNLLSNIDKIIKEENKKLEYLRQWKKGLLQQMFV